MSILAGFPPGLFDRSSEMEIRLMSPPAILVTVIPAIRSNVAESLLLHKPNPLLRKPGCASVIEKMSHTRRRLIAVTYETSEETLFLRFTEKSIKKIAVIFSAAKELIQAFYVVRHEVGVLGRVAFTKIVTTEQINSFKPVTIFCSRPHQIQGRVPKVLIVTRP